MFKKANEGFAPVRIVIEGTAVHVRYHGALPTVRKIVENKYLPTVQRAAAEMPDGTYRLQMKRERFRVVVDLIPV